MSKEVKEALRSDVPLKTLQYIDAADDEMMSEAEKKIELVKKEVATLKDDIAALVSNIDELRAAVENKPDDKYALTKTKLVRLMVDMGYLK